MYIFGKRSITRMCDANSFLENREVVAGKKKERVIYCTMIQGEKSKTEICCNGMD